MKIMGLEVNNLLSFGGTAKITFDSAVNVIVGPNDSGKTNIFRTLTFVSDVLNARYLKSFIRPYYHNGNYEVPLEIKVDLKFNNEEAKAISNFAISSELVKIPPNESDPLSNLKRLILAQLVKPIYEEMFARVTLEIKVQEPDYYLDSIIKRLRIRKSEKDLFVYPYGMITGNRSWSTSYSTKSLTDLIYADLKSKVPDLDDKFMNGHTYVPNGYNAISVVFDELKAGSNIAVTIDPINYPSLASVREKMPELISLHRFLTTRGFSNDDFNLFSVLSTIYNSGYIRTSNVRCLSDPVLFHDDARSLKIRTYGEITGKELPTILFHLKNSDDPLKRKRYNEIQKEFKSMTNMEFDVILRAVESNRAINMSSLPSSELSEIMSNKVAHSDNQDASSLKNALFEIAIYVIKNQILIPMDLVAAGLFEALYFTTTIINQTQKVILLDEPAVNLHPNWQRRILEIINKTISSGQNQVILITHSPFLVNQGLLESTPIFYA